MIVPLSISKNYVSNWRLWEAIRELIQNAQDSDKLGYTMDIHFDNGTLDITNKGTTLDISSLVLGNSTKTDDDTQIGKYGEGYKLALVVLLRLGYKVTIETGGQLWTPYFQYSTMFDSEVLTINITNLPKSDESVTFTVSGLTQQDSYELQTKSLAFRKACGYHLGETIESTYGTILLDDAFKGKFYVEGLYIQSDSTFKYGYSFKSEVVDLDRDRRAINYYDLIKLTTECLLHQDKNVKIVEHIITSKTTDLKYLKDYYNSDIPNDFAVGYAKHFNEIHHIDEDTFVGTDREVLLSGKDKTFVTDAIQASIVNQGVGKLEEYTKIKLLADQKGNKDNAERTYNTSVLHSLHNWIKHNSKRLSNKQLNEFFDIISRINPPEYSLIKKDIEQSIFEQLERDTNFKFKRS